MKRSTPNRVLHAVFGRVNRKHGLEDPPVEALSFFDARLSSRTG